MTVPVDSIVALAGGLVRLPSRGGADSPVAVLEAAGSWLAANGLEPRWLEDPAGCLERRA